MQIKTRDLEQKHPPKKIQIKKIGKSEKKLKSQKK